MRWLKLRARGRGLDAANSSRRPGVSGRRCVTPCWPANARCRRSVASSVRYLRPSARLFFFSSRRRHTRSVSAFLLNRSSDLTVTQFCRKLAAERPLKDIRDEYNYPKKKGIKDECSRLLEASTMKSRRGFAIQRLMNAMRQDHADGWFIVFDTLTLDDDRLEAFYVNTYDMSEYFCD